MQNLLHRLKPYLLPPGKLPGFLPAGSAADALMPVLWSKVMPFVRRQNARFDNSLFLSGHCNVCGIFTAFFYKEITLSRESLTCSVCLTTSRYRSIARGILRAVKDLTQVEAPSFASLRKTKINTPVRIYDTQMPFYFRTCSYPLPDLLASIPNFEVYLSRFRPQEPLGKKLSGAPNLTNQNLERLTFPDAFFDVVITSDVMEHVRNDALAHAEIRRVLKPEGVYIFTVPHSRIDHDTLHRVVVHDPNDSDKDEFVLEKEFHGDANDPENAALSYRVFGTELDETLTRLGFTVDYTNQSFPELGILNTELFYCRKF